MFQKADPFIGFVRTWTPKSDNEDLQKPQETKNTTENAIALLKSIITQYGHRLDIAATKDWPQVHYMWDAR